MSKNETIGALTVERDKAREELEQVRKELTKANEQIRRYEKCERLESELDSLEAEIQKNAIPVISRGYIFEPGQITFSNRLL